jgi:hypothetical protein
MKMRRKEILLEWERAVRIEREVRKREMNERSRSRSLSYPWIFVPVRKLNIAHFFLRVLSHE